jgi:exodeoxyribonuclease VII large subunit
MISAPASPIRLSELTGLIQLTIEGSFREQRYHVIAETTGISHYPAKKACYLTLVEKCDLTHSIKASIKARIWGQSFPCIQNFEAVTGQVFKENIQVLLQVRIHYHVHYGLALEIEDIDCNFTIGKLALSRQAVLQKLLDENPDHIREVAGEYQTFNKGLAFPPVIQNIALISSAQADGYADFRHELFQNQYGYHFQVDEYLAPVQGAEAHKEIYKQLVRIFESGKNYDAVVLVRGGGSQLDFQAFDTYLLSRAIARFPIPVITGIGHEKNESVCDLMARLKTKTPTKAAASIIAHNHSFAARLLQMEKQVVLKAHEILVSQELVLNALQTAFISQTKDLLHDQARLLQLQMNNAIHASGQRLHQENFRLLRMKLNVQGKTENRLVKEDFKLKQIVKTINHLDPRNILKRGYAVVFKDGKAVSDARSLEPGTLITTRFYAGEVESQVKSNNVPDGN